MALRWSAHRTTGLTLFLKWSRAAPCRTAYLSPAPVAFYEARKEPPESWRHCTHFAKAAIKDHRPVRKAEAQMCPAMRHYHGSSKLSKKSGVHIRVSHHAPSRPAHSRAGASEARRSVGSSCEKMENLSPAARNALTIRVFGGYGRRLSRFPPPRVHSCA